MSSNNAKRGAPERLRWDDLEVFLALVRAGTMTGAAARLGVNTSTVGRRLDGLESALGFHLFDRTSTGLVSTELAEQLMPVAESMERAAADALRLVEGRETEPEGRVRVTAPPGIAACFVAPALPELRARHPGLTIELDAAVGYADLTRREADIALRGARPRSGDLVALRVLEAQSTIAAAPELAAKVGKLGRLDAVDWITWGPELAGLPDAQWIETHVDPSRVVLWTSSMDAQIRAAHAGLGAIVLARPFLAWTGLAELKPTRTLAKRLPPLPIAGLWIVGHRALREVPRVQAVWDFLIERARVATDA
ncbi:HTH-type transcriptional regulator DmlR [Enhygromyxa salina]|uniref:HTH-type transcriptional regulator DmlR n=1 Tax=Enhygromyxa salina TaxID=215803 RepID=A0A2S9XV85_9BACT|nr:LysR family transcriptional regulator [Enhygromyxa salina]PRP96762.1 HTH-type transcriptional regulator DmlR [Enhygromyxa salina]